MPEADSWIAARLADLGIAAGGPSVVVSERPWATVTRLQTDHGPVYFKATAPGLRHEAAITAFLADRNPGLVPPPLAIDADQGWLLMADAGTRLRELIAAEHDVARWLDALGPYAQLQVDLAGAADELLDLGAPDLRLAVLPSRFERLLDELEAEADGNAAAGHSDPGELRRLRAAVPRVHEMCAELSACAIPETIQHDDLNDAAVYARDGRYHVLDWGDACVSHPFFSMSVTLEGVIAWGPDDVERSVDTRPFRDAYLAPFAGQLPPAALEIAFQLALRLGWACRAVNGRVPGTDPGATWTRLRMFLDGRP